MTTLTDVPGPMRPRLEPVDPAPEHRDPPLIYLSLRMLALHLRLLILFPLLCGAVAAMVWRFYGVGYDANVTFSTGAAQNALSSLSSVAANLGISAPGLTGSGQNTPDFYADVIDTRNMLGELVDTRYTFPVAYGSRDTLSGTLVQLLKARGRTPTQKRQWTISKLRKSLDVQTDGATGLINVDVSVHWAPLAEQIARQIATMLDRFNQEQRSSQARTEREFLAGQVIVAKAELDTAEGAMAGFLERNRSYQLDPALSFQASQLQQRVALKQTIYTTLTQQYEQARLTEVRNTPVVTVIDAPEGSAKPRIGIIILVALAIILGGIIAVSCVFAAEWGKWAASRYPDRTRELSHILSTSLAVHRWPGRIRRVLARAP